MTNGPCGHPLSLFKTNNKSYVVIVIPSQPGYTKAAYWCGIGGCGWTDITDEQYLELKSIRKDKEDERI